MTAVSKTLGTTVLALSLASAAQAEPSRRCVDESEKLVGQRAALVGGQVRPPRKLRQVPIAFPTREPEGTGSGNWLGEALIGEDGKVREVWTLRHVHFDPPWPEFEAAIAAAIRDWTYEPVVVDGKAVPVCLTVSTNINWK